MTSSEVKNGSKIDSSFSDSVGVIAQPVIEAVPIIDHRILTSSDSFHGERNGLNVPLAIPLEQYSSHNDPKAKNYETKRNTQLGTDVGKVKSFQEKESIRNVSQLAKSKPEEEAKSIKLANDIARYRQREGFDMKADKYHNSEAYVIKKVEKEEQRLAANVDKRISLKGYETKDYEINGYSGNEEYEISEYKSVYE